MVEERRADSKRSGPTQDARGATVRNDKFCGPTGSAAQTRIASGKTWAEEEAAEQRRIV